MKVDGELEYTGLMVKQVTYFVIVLSNAEFHTDRGCEVMLFETEEEAWAQAIDDKLTGHSVRPLTDEE